MTDDRNLANLLNTSGNDTIVNDDSEFDAVKERGYVRLHEENTDPVRPVRLGYVHTTCQINGIQVTNIGMAMALAFAREPGFFATAYCAACNTTAPVSEFVWDGDGEQVGS